MRVSKAQAIFAVALAVCAAVSVTVVATADEQPPDPMKDAYCPANNYLFCPEANVQNCDSTGGSCENSSGQIVGFSSFQQKTQALVNDCTRKDGHSCPQANFTCVKKYFSGSLCRGFTVCQTSIPEIHCQ